MYVMCTYNNDYYYKLGVPPPDPPPSRPATNFALAF